MTLKSLKTGAQPNLGKSRTYQMHVSSHNRRNQSINHRHKHVQKIYLIHSTLHNALRVIE